MTVGDFNTAVSPLLVELSALKIIIPRGYDANGNLKPELLHNERISKVPVNEVTNPLNANVVKYAGVQGEEIVGETRNAKDIEKVSPPLKV